MEPHPVFLEPNGRSGSDGRPGGCGEATDVSNESEELCWLTTDDWSKEVGRILYGKCKDGIFAGTD